MATLRVGNKTVVPIIREEVPVILDNSVVIGNTGLGKAGKTSTNFALPSNCIDVKDYGMNGLFYLSTTLQSVDLSNLTIVSGESAMQDCFYNCINLTSVDLSGLTTLSGQYGMQDCFAGCSGLTSVNLSSLTTVNNQGAMVRCFYNCINLTSVDLSGLTTLSGQNAMLDCFQGCRSLTSVDLSSITSISGNSVVAQCFSGCRSLTAVTIGNANQEISFDLPNTNQLSAMLTGCSQNITLNIATTEAVLSQFTGYDTSGNGHHFGCTGVVTINYLV